ncbi:hypothetical protein D9M69_452290 [compost metagenome]
MALEHLQHGGVEGGDGRAFLHAGIGADQALHGAFAGHGDLHGGHRHHGRVGVGDEVQAVQRVEDVAEGTDADDEDSGAEADRLQAGQGTHAAARAALARLGKVFALQGVEQVAGADQFAGQVGADQVAQGGDVARLQVVEHAADALLARIHGAYLEFDVQAQAEAVDLEHQAAPVVVADVGAGASAGEGEAAGGDVQQRRFEAFAASDVADLAGDLHPCVLALGFGFMHHIEIDGCIHGFDSCQVPCAHTIASSVAMNTLVAEKVMAREDQVLNQREKLARSRLSLVFWRVQDCWSRRKKT